MGFVFLNSRESEGVHAWVSDVVLVGVERSRCIAPGCGLAFLFGGKCSSTPGFDALLLLLDWRNLADECLTLSIAVKLSYGVSVGGVFRTGCFGCWPVETFSQTLRKRSIFALQAPRV